MVSELEAENIARQLDDGNACALSREIHSTVSQSELRDMLDQVRQAHRNIPHATSLPDLDIQFQPAGPNGSTVLVLQGTWSAFYGLPIAYKAAVTHSPLGTRVAECARTINCDNILCDS